MVTGRGLTTGLVASVALIVGALSWMGWTLFLNAGHLLPSPSWLSAILVLLMAPLVISAGVPVRRFLRGQAVHTLNPIRAARTLVLAQAAALTGAAVLGWYAGQLVCALSDLSLDHNRALVWPLAVTSAAALVLAVAGLLTQRMCRIPKPPEEE
jgi:Protein of unknown function (DUF3180)